MFQKQFYNNVNMLLRQVYFLTGKGKHLDDAIAEIESKPGLNKAVIAIKSITSGTQEQNSLPYQHGYILLLSKILRVVKSNGNDVGTCFNSFYNAFIQNPHRVKLQIKDSAGLLGYLAAITVVSAIVVTIYLVYVLPAFRDMYNGAGHELPELTRFVLTFSSKFSGIFISVIVFVVVFVLLLLKKMFANVNNLQFFSERLLKVPFLGEIFRAFNVYLSLNILWLLTRSGMGRQESIEALENLSENNSGVDTKALLAKEIITPFNAEYSLSVASSLDTFNEELEHLVQEHQFIDADKLNQLKTGILSFFIVFAIIIFGTVLVAMYLPIFQMGKILT